MSIEALKEIGCEIFPTGSAYICNPPVTNTDTDYLVLVKDDAMLKRAFEVLGEGWDIDGSEHYQVTADSTFISYRNNSINLIVTKNGKFAKKHRVATEVCKALNVLDKAHRVIIFQAMLYDNPPVALR